MVGKRDLAEEFKIVVAIKCPPSTICILHRFQPLPGAFDGCRCAGQAPSICHASQRLAPRAQGDHNHGRIVDVGIEAVGVFKTPPRGGHRGDPVRPIPAGAHLTLEQPIDSRIKSGSTPTQGRRIAIATRGPVGIRKSPEREGGVPHRRAAGLQPGCAVALVFDQASQLAPTFLHLGGIVLAPHRPQGHDAPDDRRENSSQPITFVKSLQHPAPAFSDSPAAQRFQSNRLTAFEQLIDPEKKPTPAAALAARQGSGAHAAGSRLRRKEFGDACSSRDVTHRLIGPDERQRHNHGA